jgi:hypothetical protein
MWIECGVFQQNNIIDSRFLFCLYQNDNVDDNFVFQVGLPAQTEHEIHMGELSTIFCTNITLLSQLSHKAFLSIYKRDLIYITLFIKLWKAPFGTKYNLISELFFPAVDLWYQRAKTVNKNIFFHLNVVETYSTICWTIDNIICKRNVIYVN